MSNYAYVRDSDDVVIALESVQRASVPVDHTEVATTESFNPHVNNWTWTIGGGFVNNGAIADIVVATDASIDGSGTEEDPLSVPNVVIRTGHTWAISGEISVASGDDDFLNPFFVSLATGQTMKVVKVRYKINSGTNCNIKLQKNGVDLTGFTNITVTTSEAETDPTDQALADDDKLALIVNSVSGTPTNLSFTVFIESTV